MEQVNTAKEEFNLLIRNRLSGELRFSLQGQPTTRLGRVGISILLAPGFPAPLHEFAAKPVEDYAADLIAVFGADVERLESSSQGVAELLRRIRDHDEKSTTFWEPYLDALETANGLSQLLKARAERASLAKQLFAIQDDILGTYCASADDWGTVELYWGAIGVVAELLQVRVEDLTVVALIHELAHGYTHLGKDIDNELWPGGLMFDIQNRPVVEAVAQYYTEIISEHIGDVRRPDVHRAYLRLRRQQRGLYRIHDRWTREFSSEVMRSALVKYRRRGGRELGFFEDLLQEERERLGAAGRPPHFRLQEDIEIHGELYDEIEELFDVYLIRKNSNALEFQPVSKFLAALGQEWQLPLDLPLAYRVSPWSVAKTPEFKKSVGKQDKTTRSRIFEAIMELMEEPVSPKGDIIKPLTGDLEGLWRYRIGDSRLIYQADKNARLVTLVDFRPRGSAYEP